MVQSHLFVKFMMIECITGSVGMFAVQLAHAAGYKVVTTASPRNHDLLKSFGADEVFDVRPLTASKIASAQFPLHAVPRP